MADIIQIRNDVEANWVSANPILAQGELAITTDTTPKKIKIGDGTSNWSNLVYFDQYNFDQYVSAATAAKVAAELAAVNSAGSATNSQQYAVNASNYATNAQAQAELVIGRGLYLPEDNLSITYNADGTVNTVSNGTLTKRITYSNGVAVGVATI